MRTYQLIALACILISSSNSLQAESDNTVSQSANELNANVVLASDVEWSPLNPVRGNKGPMAGALWGDRTGSGSSGFLVKFTDGFSSPPHIHNITYRGVVIRGLIHNDDPEAEDLWLPTGSFWTQPKGENHITAARGSNNLAYIEIEEGPYLVLPSEEAFDGGERPINVDESNLVWLDASNIKWIEQPGIPTSTEGPKVAFLWGNPQDDQLNGTLVKLPAGFTGVIQNQGSFFRAVVIQGRLNHQLSGETKTKSLEPGSYFGSEGESRHMISLKKENESIIYVRTKSKFNVISTHLNK
ncbi:MAG: hypothetical protein DHS20C09_11530 [marine bacterium B5-7]|nr:MAG: hypothetical protein DHS20C09_11530 [marine bacterium B5-7]